MIRRRAVFEAPAEADTDAARLLDDLTLRGVRLRVDGEVLSFEAPVGTLTTADREALRAHKVAVLGLLRERQAKILADVIHVPLRALTRVLEVAVPWADVPLLIAPGCRVARELRQADSRPGRVWCVCEVLDLLLTNVPPDDARKIAEARLTFDADTITVSR